MSVSTDGIITVKLASELTQQKVGQIQLHQFINPQGLNLLGGSLFVQSESSGPAMVSKPGEHGAGQILQGFLEGSNVDPVKERLRMRFLQNWRATIMSVIDQSR